MKVVKHVGLKVLCSLLLDATELKKASMGPFSFKNKRRRGRFKMIKIMVEYGQ